jgi:hypothetical protein
MEPGTMLALAAAISAPLTYGPANVTIVSILGPAVRDAVHVKGLFSMKAQASPLAAAMSIKTRIVSPEENLKRQSGDCPGSAGFRRWCWQ